MFSWFGHKVCRHRGLVIATWGLFLAAGTVFAPQVTTYLKVGGHAETESEAAEEVLQ